MYSWRITKYNPSNRNSEGSYILDEWTEYSDIGEIFDNKILKFDEYEFIENLYIQTVLFFMDSLDIQGLKLVHLDKDSKLDADEYTTSKMKALFGRLKEGMIISKEDIPDIIRLIMRLDIGGKLLSNKGLFISWGYDFYMYAAALVPCIDVLEKIKMIGLYAEEKNIKDFIFPEINRPIKDPWVEVFRK